MSEQNHHTVKYTLLFLCITSFCSAQSYKRYPTDTAQIVIDMGKYFPSAIDGNMTVGYHYFNCDTFSLPVMLVVEICDTMGFEPCTFYYEKNVSMIPEFVVWTCNKIPRTIWGTLLVESYIKKDGRIILQSEEQRIIMENGWHPSDSVKQ